MSNQTEAIVRPHEEPCPSCGWEMSWHDGEEDWASCPNCDLPVKFFGMAKGLEAVKAREEAVKFVCVQARIIAEWNNANLVPDHEHQRLRRLVEHLRRADYDMTRCVSRDEAERMSAASEPPGTVGEEGT